MKTYISSTYDILCSYGFTPLATVYKYSNGETIYVADGTVSNVGKMKNITICSGMQSLGILLFETNLNDSELA